MQKLKDVMVTKITEINMKLKLVDEKLEKVEDTKTVLIAVDKMIKESEDRSDVKVCEVRDNVARIEEKELTCHGLFGPKSEAREYLTMKDFVVKKLEQERKDHAEKLKSLRDDMGK